MNMFEFASKNKLRFPHKGVISTEDLWDLSVKDLDSIFKTLNAQKKQSEEDSLLSVKTKEDETLTMQIDIVKHIVARKLADVESAKEAKAVSEQKQKLMSIIEAKENEELHKKTPDELRAMLLALAEKAKKKD